GEYAILCDEDDVNLFSPFGRVIGLSSLPSLNNSRDSLRLLTANGELIDQVFYEIAWYRGSDKSEGGWSLERIDLSPTGCNDPFNWLPSEATFGGTPGQVNSVVGSYTDETAPLLEGSLILSTNELRLRFNEQMD
ncbi:MAG: hypothetical protein AAGM67_19010, partial [Bacteroidota bacterium]